MANRSALARHSCRCASRSPLLNPGAPFFGRSIPDAMKFWGDMSLFPLRRGAHEGLSSTASRDGTVTMDNLSRPGWLLKQHRRVAPAVTSGNAGRRRGTNLRQWTNRCRCSYRSPPAAGKGSGCHMPDDLESRLARARNGAAEARAVAKYLRVELRRNAASLRHLAAAVNLERDRTRQLLNQYTALMNEVRPGVMPGATNRGRGRSADPER